MAKMNNHQEASTYLDKLKKDGMKVKLTRLARCAAGDFFLNDSRVATIFIKESGKMTI